MNDLLSRRRLLSVDSYDAASYNRSMKVTALIPDKLIEALKELAEADTLTDSLILAISEWTALERIKQLNEEIRKHPLKFKKGFTAEKIRNLNRRQ